MTSSGLVNYLVWVQTKGMTGMTKMTSSGLARK